MYVCKMKDGTIHVFAKRQDGIDYFNAHNNWDQIESSWMSF